MKDPNCDFCLAVRGVCTDCEGCFGGHCQCDPCQHGKARAEECVFCSRGFVPLTDAMVKAEPDNVQAALDWLLG